MFDIGFWELVVIGVVALVVLGPERLPVAIRTATHWIRLIRSTANSVKSELEQELKLQELHNDLKKAEQLQMSNLSPELQASIDQLKAAAQSVNRPYQGQNEIRPPSAESVASSAPRAPLEPVVPITHAVPPVHSQGSCESVSDAVTPVAVVAKAVAKEEAKP
ncbi:MAG: Sec-independent protein translocase protein TatB [Aeromonas sp.]